MTQSHSTHSQRLRSLTDKSRFCCGCVHAFACTLVALPIAAHQMEVKSDDLSAPLTRTVVACCNVFLLVLEMFCDLNSRPTRGWFVHRGLKLLLLFGDFNFSSHEHTPRTHAAHERTFEQHMPRRIFTVSRCDATAASSRSCHAQTHIHCVSLRRNRRIFQILLFSVPVAVILWCRGTRLSLSRAKRTFKRQKSS
jgi:hypothetical protein